MGILDDAIREHLELKRRHGVSEEELQRQEEEALGPARRDVAQQVEDSELAPGQPVGDETDGAGEAPASAIAEADEAPAAEQEAGLFDMERDDAEAEAEMPPATADNVAEQTAVHEVPEPAEPTPVEPPPVEPPPVEDEAPPAEPDAADRLGDTQPHGFEPVEDDLDDEAELMEESELTGETGLAGDEAEEDLLATDPEDDELDVLEDTPDFLQETPEHDRLWFEQKPPRDFDFD